MKLRYNQLSQEILDIEARIHDMSLACSTVISDEELPALIDGKSVYLGLEEMNAYLDLLDSEKDLWYYCNC